MSPSAGKDGNLQHLLSTPLSPCLPCEGGDESKRMGDEEVVVSRGDTVAGGDATTMRTVAGVGAGSGSGRIRCFKLLDEDDEVSCRGATVTREKGRCLHQRKRVESYKHIQNSDQGTCNLSLKEHNQ